ncbi:MAG: heavy-metal-associated domain-containing protein [Ignavibacteria bacterium]|nr:heavy-metal-associated domain-containing protein [Ignavibacteria bacterium]
MITVKFKTNINCSNCIKAVTPFLDENNDIEEWEIDLDNPQKILSVSGKNIIPSSVIDIIEKAGYKIEILS